MAKESSGVGPKHPQVVVLFGATGDLAKRKLIPGLFHLSSSRFIPDCRIVGTSLDALSVEEFQNLCLEALTEFSSRKIDADAWEVFKARLDYVPLSAGAKGLKKAVQNAKDTIDGECDLLHYLSIPPNAALSVIELLGEANLIERARVIMEKPFGVDLESAIKLNGEVHKVFSEEQVFRIDHFLGKEPAQNILP